MRSLKVALFAGAAIAAAFTSAQAADLPPIMQAPQMLAPQVQEQMGGWYLRGDIGVGQQKFTEFNHTQTNSAFVWPASWRIDQREMGDATFIGGGIGYQWNSWLRFDATAEYRAKTKFKAVGSYTEFCPGGRCFDVYDGNHSAVVLMANAYVDLGTWMCLTPFVGVGAGYAHRRYFRPSVPGFTGFASEDDAASVYGSVGRRLSRDSQVDLSLYASWYGNDVPGEANVTGLGATVSYSRNLLLERLRMIAALGIYHTDSGATDSTVASALAGLRYTF